MKWEGQRESDNVEDLRDQGGGGGGSGFGGFGARHIGIGTIVIALIGGWIFGINPLTILGLLSGGGAPVQHSAPAPVQPGQPGQPVARGQEVPGNQARMDAMGNCRAVGPR